MARDPGFLEELKRRKVVRAAVVYGAVVWAVVQAADVFVPALGLPEVIVTVVAVLSLLGFPVALVLAWTFDLTTGGFRRDADSGERERGRWLSVRTVVVATVLLGLGYLMGTVTGSTPGVAESPGSARSGIAVLPFDAVGAADEMGFVDGVHDDILTQLSRIQDLRVVSRTSVQAYRGTRKSAREVAGELGVQTVLDGSVQRTPTRVRINMQLVDGATDETLWAETLDRELTAENVFRIQSEIAMQVAQVLQATLSPEEEARITEVPTRDMEALDLYHRARRVWEEVNNDRRSGAIPILEAAVERDPAFVQAWVALARSLSWEVREGASGDTLPAARAVARVEELAPGSPEAHTARGYYRYFARGRFQDAMESFQAAVAEAPADTDLIFVIGAVYRRMGRFQDAVDHFTRTVEAEPRNAQAVFDLAWTHRVLRNFDEAEALFRRVMALNPDGRQDMERQLMELALLARGDLPSARTLAEGWEAEPLIQSAREYLRYLSRDPGFLEDPLPAPGGVGGSASFGSYTLVDEGSPRLWRARSAWVLGDTARARGLARGLEEEYRAGIPLLAPTSNVLDPGEDHFAARASGEILRGWEHLFLGDPAEALAAADRGVALYPPEGDGVQGQFILRQRAMIRTLAGDHAGAVEDLRRLLTLPGWTTRHELRLDPLYAPLEGRSDFQALLAG